jgi:hypothetical protein
VTIEEDEREECQGVRVYDGNIVYFEDYMKEKECQTWDNLRNTLLFNEYTDEVIEEEKEKYLNDFYEWCEENNLRGEEV